ncbi:MAG: NAD(P)H-hydrate epimerase, partial [Methylocystaceae bacterium]|nr:NAD(P)H-hydrate epimerase [Methylocystaceae bacterium]
MAKSSKNCLLSVADMYEADRLTITNGISGIQLMEAAGSAIAREIRKRWSPRKTVILCGPGNNGGDG